MNWPTGWKKPLPLVWSLLWAPLVFAGLAVAAAGMTMIYGPVGGWKWLKDMIGEVL